MKIIQVVDGADNATFSLFEATEDEFSLIFPGDQQDMALIEDVASSPNAKAAFDALGRIWNRPILKRDAYALNGVLFYDNDRRRADVPASRREIDLADHMINEAQRRLFASRR